MDFVFLSTQGWDEMDGAGRPIHYFARELLARGDRVLYVQVVPQQKPVAQTNLTVVDFGALGFDETALRRVWFGLDPRVAFPSAFARVLDAFQEPAAERVVVYADPCVPFVALFPLFRARHYKTVYDALDDFEAFPEIGLYFANRDAEKFLVAHSDLVVAVSTTLMEKLTRWAPRAPIRLLRQGFDAAAFCPPPSPPPRASKQITLGFWGHVNAFNVDIALLEYVARARPQWTLQLIGPLDLDPALPRVEPALRALPNVQLLGPVAHADLNKHLQAFDIALVPFPDNAFNRARDPLKVLEYLAGYKPVVAAHTPQLAGMPYVFLANTPEEFLAAIEHALTIRVDRAQVDAYLAECAWDKRVDQLLTWLAQTQAAAETPTPAVAQWYADAALNANTREYIARTEQLLDERTRYLRALEHDAQAKQAHIQRLQQKNPFWKIKGLFGQ
jgi:glycosyltransferase involved in cell wall biosynthesis